ncbi:MAG TPA: hypothetical protein VLT36_12755 [Candidatus Dormibacteraeota bacterium]|nr:hypothetical protein [Candidatus Dormibacteraeota bacterium]
MLGTLPAAVQNTVRAETGTARVAEVRTNVVHGTEIYQVRFENYYLYPPLLVARDGSVLNRDLSVAVGAPKDTTSVLVGGPVTGGLKVSDLPAPVVKVIQERGATSQISSIDRELWGNQIVYIVSFSDEVHYPKLYLNSDGALLKEGHK